MNKKNHTSVIRTLHVTEKTNMLSALKDSESNACISKFKQAKYVFLVELDANKFQIKKAVEEAYKEQNITVEKVNTVRLPRKPKHMRSKTARFRKGASPILKKAIVTLKEGHEIDFES